MTLFFTIVALIIAYLLGSIPSAFVIGKLRKGFDIRKVGTKNMGAMNTFYSVGFWWGMLVLVIDIGKGMLAVLVPRWLGAYEYMDLAGGVLAIVGHNFPVFLKFRISGKGGATLIGVLAILMPLWGMPIYLAAFGLVLLITRFPTLSYGVAFLAFPILAIVVYHNIVYMIYSIALLLLPVSRYIFRIKEIKGKADKKKGGGGIMRAIFRKSIKERM
jgi:acyl phosphate:glycerol-3-phosphate acyltransferase